MIKKLEQAIERVRKLPGDRQAYAAMLLEEVAAEGPFKIPDDHKPAVLEGLAQARRGERASDAEMLALWKKCGL